jgi:hypothetical protein
MHNQINDQNVLYIDDIDLIADKYRPSSAEQSLKNKLHNRLLPAKQIEFLGQAAVEFSPTTV